MPRFQYSLVNFPFKHNFEVPGTIEVFVQRIHQTVLNSSIQRLEIDTSASCGQWENTSECQEHLIKLDCSFVSKSFTFHYSCIRGNSVNSFKNKMQNTVVALISWDFRLLSVLIYFPVYGYVICDHMRAVHVYMSALNGSCMLTGFPCSSYEQFLAGQCTSCDETFNSSCPQIGKTQLFHIHLEYHKACNLTRNDLLSYIDWFK